jgi:O-methyltransferase involved in polyketide biosynthesis
MENFDTKHEHPGRISPTAHYTGYVWQLHGLSTPALSTTAGRVLYDVCRPFNALSQLFGGPTLSAMLLARHQAIDRTLAEAIDRERVTQVLEIAAGYSARGWRFTRRYGDRIRYVEADLPHMAERKQSLLMGVPRAERPRVVPINALEESGPLSLANVAQRFDPGGGLAVITEGLLGYLERDAVLGLWSRIAATLGAFRGGMYLSDIRLAERNRDSVAAALFMSVLSAFVRGRVYVHFATAAEIQQALHAAGFGSVAVHQTAGGAGADYVQVIEARRCESPRDTAAG